MEYLVVGVVVIVVFLGLFLLLRELNLWYWRINEIVVLLKEIKQLLKGDAPTATDKVINTVSSEVKPGDYITKWKCPKCNTMNHPNLKQCFNCGTARPV